MNERSVAYVLKIRFWVNILKAFNIWFEYLSCGERQSLRNAVSEQNIYYASALRLEPVSTTDTLTTF